MVQGMGPLASGRDSRGRTMVNLIAFKIRVNRGHSYIQTGRSVFLIDRNRGTGGRLTAFGYRVHPQHDFTMKQNKFRVAFATSSPRIYREIAAVQQT